MTWRLSYGTEALNISISPFLAQNRVTLHADTVAQKMLDALEKDLAVEWMMLEKPDDFRAMSVLPLPQKQSLFAWVVGLAIKPQLLSDNQLVGDEYAEERSRERKGDIAAAMERAFAEQAAETEGFDAVIASKTARWLPDGMAIKGVDDLMETSSSPSKSDVDAADDDGEIASDAEDSAPDALPAFLSETAA